MVSGHSESTGSDVGSSAGSGAQGHDDRAKREPQDSETPWTGTLVLSQLGVDGVVDGSDVTVCWRAVRAQGIARPNWDVEAKGQDVLVLTEEEIKDVVSSTGLWLVVRRDIGGVGRISRKGDGWPMRRNFNFESESRCTACSVYRGRFRGS
ncbi:hypothetical protein BC827DRAFT_1269966 [Russula dissimulans]|nr:hypothetical protein BC827DRAFT_1269966 [Russula dissimulans]